MQYQQNKPPLIHHQPMMKAQLTIRRTIMAKGQQRANKEVKKPKKSKEVIVPAGFITPAKPSLPAKK
jgi:hypothetical protein